MATPKKLSSPIKKVPPTKAAAAKAHDERKQKSEREKHLSEIAELKRLAAKYPEEIPQLRSIQWL